jgi:hypothetical protein
MHSTYKLAHMNEVVKVVSEPSFVEKEEQWILLSIPLSSIGFPEPRDLTAFLYTENATRTTNSKHAICLHPIVLFQLVANKVSSSRKYSPQSACLKHVIPVGSNLLASAVLLAVTPNPNGVSFILYTTTPARSWVSLCPHA